MLEAYGVQAMHGARAVSAAIRDGSAERESAKSASCHDIVRVMDFLLSDDMDQTIH